MDVSDSSCSGVEKNVSSLGSSEMSSSARSIRGSTAPALGRRHYLRRVMRTAWQEATEEQARHHHVLSLAFLLVVVCFLMVWCLDISSQSVMNRVFTSPQARWYHTPSSTASPSAVNTVEGNLDGVAADAKNSVKEFFALAGNFMSPQPQRYTRDEVAQHRTADDLWIVIDGNVLDVSLFIHQHPGGLVLLDGAGGQDMATVFARFHHPSSVRLFANFCIGHVVGA